ncbi:MAG: hypothetical protein FJY95_22965 [Candidatus Handelsmanbacteria bacterium]|nr:hypothetical protein [Candidatus Handelsmanbacteria bacterium]
MADITLTKGATSLVLPSPEHPEEWGTDLDQTRYRAMGGRVMTLTRSAVTRSAPVLHWSQMSEDEKDDLVDFIFLTCVGSANSFTLTDWNGDTHTVRYFGGLEKATSTEYDAWRVDLALVEE